jgi:hypothetical protein
MKTVIFYQKIIKIICELQKLSNDCELTNQESEIIFKTMQLLNEFIMLNNIKHIKTN